MGSVGVRWTRHGRERMGVREALFILLHFSGDIGASGITKARGGG